VTERNPLQQLIAIAEANRALWHVRAPVAYTSLLALPDGSTTSPFPTNDEGVVYPSRELGGVAGLYAWLQASSVEVLFANDLAYEVRGIDAVAYDAAADRYVLCEAKGTTRAFTSPGSYLKWTHLKGRQLSWLWCWASLIDLAEHGPAADAFLTLLRPLIIEGRVDRLLAVTRLQPIREGFTIQETRVWNEDALSRYAWLREPHDWTKHRAWLHDEEQDASQFKP
jgi:hypothetical protein